MIRVLFALAFFACALPVVSPAGAAGPVRVGLSLGLTGKYAPMSTMQDRGFRLWAEEINGRGGLAGRPVELVIRDDRGDPARAAAIYEDLIGKDHVDVLFAPYSSEMTRAILPVVERAGYPMLGSGASGDALWEGGVKNLFGVYIPASRYALGFMEMLAIRDVDALALVHAEDPFSMSAAQGARKWAPMLGREIVMDAPAAKDAPGWAALAEKARNAGARAVIVCGYLKEAVAMRRGMATAGYAPEAYYATVGPALSGYSEELGAALAEKAFSSSLWRLGRKMNFPGSAEFARAFEDKYGMAPSYHAATAYAAGQILEQAVKKAGDLNKDKMRDMFSKMETTTIIGRYGVDATGKQIRHFPLIIQIQNGQAVAVWPPELAEADPILVP